MKKTPKKSTALVRRKPAKLRKYHWQAGPSVQDRRLMVPVAPASALTLPSDPMMVATFVGTLKLSEEQITSLRRPVLDKELDWKAAVTGGEAIIPYLSHNGYRDRLDAAFGLGGWGMVPVGMPKQVGTDFLYVPYALVINGLPHIYAWGEQQINRMTYGDALEGCKSNAIVRCGKELGIARELWDKKNVASLLVRKGSIIADGATRSSSPRPSDAWHAKEDEPITDPQRKRLYVIATKSGRSEREWKGWIKAAYRVSSTKAIKRRDYEAICETIGRPGELPLVQADREPGMEG